MFLRFLYVFQLLSYGPMGLGYGYWEWCKEYWLLASRDQKPNMDFPKWMQTVFLQGTTHSDSVDFHYHFLQQLPELSGGADGKLRFLPFTYLVPWF